MIGSRYCHFEIERLLGTGGMGEVYLAVDMNLERRVALKFLPKTLTGDRTAQGRLLDEARSCARLTHPNIVGIHSVEEDGGVFAICMEYVEGKTVREILGQRRIEMMKVVEIALGVARGLAAAHEHGIIHRDLKPANVVITGKGQAKVMDFGLALRPRRTVETTGPESYGTVSYMSPEQARGMSLTPSTDIFSFGSLLYKIVTTRLPFEGENDLATLHAIISSEPTPLRELRRDIPPGLERLIMACLAKKREDRPSSMDEIVTILQRLAGPTRSAPRDVISELTTGLETESLRRRHSRKVRPISKPTAPAQGPASASGPAAKSRAPQGDAFLGATTTLEEFRPEERFPRKTETGTVVGSGPVTPRRDPGPRSAAVSTRGTTPGREQEGAYPSPQAGIPRPTKAATKPTAPVHNAATGLDTSPLEAPHPLGHEAEASKESPGLMRDEFNESYLLSESSHHWWKTALGAVVALVLAAAVVFALVHFVLRPRMQSEEAVTGDSTTEVQSSVIMPIQQVAAIRGQLQDAVEPLPEMIEIALPPAPGNEG